MMNKIKTFLKPKPMSADDWFGKTYLKDKEND